MKIVAISDLHLGFGVAKPMDIFGAMWMNHSDKIKENWLRMIAQEDIVLLPGDLSWGMTLEEAMPDLRWIQALPGKKIFVKGNHDYWWEKIQKLNQLDENMHFLQNTCYKIHNTVICGTRGWICPNPNQFTEEDAKIYKRELIRLELSLKEAKKQALEAIIVMLHYPPTNDLKEPSGFTELIEEYKVKQVVYGHLHGESSTRTSLEGLHVGTNYTLVSADRINFKPFIIKN